MAPSSRPFVARYACALVSVALALSGRLALDPVLGSRYPFATIFFAIMVTAFYGGARPALVAVVVGGLGADVLLLPPRGQLFLDNEELIGLALYMVTGAGIAWLGGSMHAARHRAEASAAAIHRQATLIDQCYDAVLAWQWGGPITLWNKGAERLYGYPSEAGLGRVCTDLLRTTAAVGLATVLEVLEREGFWEGELEHVAQNGATRVVESRMVLVRDGQRAYVLEVDRDISERKKAHAALLEARELLESRVVARTADLAASEERSRQVLEGVPTGVIAVNARGDIVLVNSRIEQQFGYARDEMIGQPVDLLLPEPLGGEHWTGFVAATETRVINPGDELRGRRKDGSEIPLEIGLSPVTLADERLVLCSTVDISKRKRSEALRREASTVLEMFHLMIDSIKDYAIVRLDPAGRIVTWNPGAHEINGYNSEEILGRSVALFYPPEAQATAQGHMAIAASRGRVDYESWHMRKDGTRFWASIVITAIRDPHTAEPLGFVKVTRDLTERKRAEDSKTAALAENTVLLQEVHHRVKNNLQMIASLLNLQMRQIKDARARAVVLEAQTRVRAIALLHEILYQSGDLGHVPMREYVDKFVAAVRRTYRPCRRIVSQVADIHLPVDVAVPCGLIMNELVTNALKHGFGDARISERDEIRIDLQKQDDNTITMSVTDNGHGLPGTVDPTADATMGLSLVRDLSIQLRGQTVFVSGDGVRGTLTFQHPRPAEPASPHGVHADDATGGRDSAAPG